MQITDPPTAAQVSVMIERMNNLADDMRQMRKSQAVCQGAVYPRRLIHQSNAARAKPPAMRNIGTSVMGMPISYAA